MRLALGALALAASVSAAPAPLLQRATETPPVDYNELHNAALLASAAYSGCTGSAFGVQIVSQIDNTATSTQGFIGYDASNDRIVTAFRGSTAVWDFINDIDIVPVRPSLSGVEFPSDAFVMNGIVAPYSSVHDQVIKTIEALLAGHPTATLEVTGHSLGGSLTYLAHAAIARNFPNTSITSNALAAFAIGNSAFASWAGGQPNGRLRRGNEIGDGVPNLYPQFAHYGTEFYGSSNAAAELECVGELDPQCSAGDGAYGITLEHLENSGVIMEMAGCG